MSRVPLLRYGLAAVGLLALTAACGRDEAAKKAEPAPVAAGTSPDTHSLASGNYYLSDLHDLQDGCAKRPLDSASPITQVPFVLTNDGAGNVSVDFCSYNDHAVAGVVRGNSGTLAALHHDRHAGTGTYVAVFDQECRIDLTVPADDEVAGQYTETQRNRNAALRQATVDLDQCTTSFTFTMKKKS